ncbi:MAG: UDP-N-acetylmuramoyl-tripeptide--D-alanyl-D-alanine ligase [bacterium]|nr:UDP-N-acetylmuramoyl-tripeptide--D-alanyl-D-alanine ligase [bacterium]
MIAWGLDEIAAAMGGRVTGATDGRPINEVSTDTRTIPAGALFFAIRGPTFDGHDYVDQAVAKGAAACVVSRPIGSQPIPYVVVDDTVAALGRLAAAHRDRMQATVIAVTGSNGKTTTKEMIYHVLATRLSGRAAPRSFNNEIGVPLTLLSAREDDRYLVVEIGTNAPGEVAALAALARPDIGVITSIAPAHLAGLGGLQGVVREKTSLLRHVRPGGLALVPGDRPGLRAVAQGVLADGGAADTELLTFGLSDTADLHVGDVSGDLNGTRFRINGGPVLSLAVCGPHNATNAAATYAACRRMGLTDDQIATGLATFQPTELRLNVRRFGSVTVINDSYNANPGSMASAIDVLAAGEADRRLLVVGDMLELGEEAAQWHERVGRRAAEVGIDVIVAAGAQAANVAAGARAADTTVETLACADADEAGRAIAQLLQDGDVILIKGSRAMGMERVARCLEQTQAKPGRRQQTLNAADAAVTTPCPAP